MAVLLYFRYKISQDPSSLADERNIFVRNVANTKPGGVTFQKTGPLKYCAVITSKYHCKEMPEKMAVRGAEFLNRCDIIMFSRGTLLQQVT
jgi:hypothetical protein